MTIEYDESLEPYFLTEASDLIQTIEQNLFNLLEAKTIERVHTLMRGAHTIKGSAANCGLKTVETIAHHLEDVFQALYAEDLTIDAELGSLLLEGYECLREPLNAIFNRRSYDEAQILDRTATVFAKLQHKLGDFFGRETELPSSEDLGFDVVGLIFSDSVPQDLEQLEKIVQSGDSDSIEQILTEKAIFFGELATSYDLIGLALIAKATIAALEQHPNRVVEVAIAALSNLQEAYAAVMAGDRQKGGQLSVELATWAGISLASIENHAANSLEDWDTDDRPRIDTPSALPQEEDLLSLLEEEPIAPVIKTNYHREEEEDLLSLLEEEPIAPIIKDSPNSHPENEDLLVLLDESEPETIDIFSRVDDGESLMALQNEAIEEEIEMLDWEEQDDSEPKTEIFQTAFVDNSDFVPASKSEEKAGQIELFNSEASIIAKSPIDRILTSISVSKVDREPVPAIAPKPSEKIRPTADLPTIRVAIEQVDRLSHAIAELSIGDSQQNLRLEQIQSSVKQASEQFLGCQRELEKIRDWSDKNLLLPESIHNQRQQFITGNRLSISTTDQFDSLEMDVYSDLHLLLQNLSERMLELGQKIESIDSTLQKNYLERGKRKQLLGNAREDLLQARTIALGTIFQRFPRLIQQAISTHNKPAQLQIIGSEVLVDKAIAEKLYDPLLHLIRNAYDHGLEDVETRVQQGKEATGTITVSAYDRGNRIAIEVRDDGAGLNWERIRTKALERNILLPSQAANISEDELAQVLFEPGFSTADRVSDLSGRGIGLDVVRNQIQAVQGTISIRSTAGEGTTFTLQIPLALTTARLLICQSQGLTYALIADAIERVLLPRSEQIQEQPSLTGKGTDRFLRWEEGEQMRLIPIRKLNEIVEYRYPLPPRTNALDFGSIPIPKQNANSLLLLKNDRLSLCIEVEQSLLEKELTIKSLGNSFQIPSYVQGYCILDSGSLCLAIDPVESIVFKEGRSSSNSHNITSQIIPTNAPIIAEAELIEDTPSDNESDPPLILGGRLDLLVLVVEDSIVQRQSIVRSFSKAGYAIVQASNGQEALAQLKQHPNIRLIVCDIEMPYMNGFEFLSYRRQDYRLAQIPTIMLTSRSGNKHRQFALALGANAYITKPYADRELLEVAGQLVVSG
jgi:two-component system, chemotaxis family, sensor histidine kinase and response regulator PixL